MTLASDILTLLGHTTNTLNQLMLSDTQGPPRAKHCTLALRQLLATAEAAAKLAEVAHVEALTTQSAAAAAGAAGEMVEGGMEGLKSEAEAGGVEKEDERAVVKEAERTVSLPVPLPQTETVPQTETETEVDAEETERRKTEIQNRQVLAGWGYAFKKRGDS
ncbi:uncharacterized protein LAJ45_10312 [Morchella importuna]|uniref:uncharacterized protein n=1 Tax=Morchella importuna TaxID=1174673 RepID=UPI001E8D34E8|nr:uncharacterized protein LAJ45_10312 [Morchella importuna]KAH8145672.1 hypothetical protein LAJ45_10312 [Morchella importuna]